LLAIAHSQPVLEFPRRFPIKPAPATLSGEARGGLFYFSKVLKYIHVDKIEHFSERKIQKIGEMRRMW
jgi:hypothetical protein